MTSNSTSAFGPLQTYENPSTETEKVLHYREEGEFRNQAAELIEKKNKKDKGKTNVGS